MNAQTMTLEQIRVAGMAALSRELGIVGMIRFIQQFEIGTGDYSNDRHHWQDGQDVETIAGRIRENRKKNNTE